MAKNWYIVQTYSGFEEKVKVSLEGTIQERSLEDRITRILVPSERVLELRGGKKRETQKVFYPGYILVEMELDDETWHVIRNTPKVSGFVGGAKPVPVPEEEIPPIIQQLEKGPTSPLKMQFITGEVVRVKDGPFTNFAGTVEDVDMDHGRLRVMVSIFGRLTPVELNFFQVEKA